MKNYCVYKHTSPKGKVYIGITSQRPYARWARGASYKNNWHFYNAILKYGWDNFEHEILYKGLTNEEANRKEIELIALYDSTNPDKGYNRDPGGNLRAVVSEETKQKISRAKKGKPAVKGEAHPMYGRKKELCPTYKRPHTDDERMRMRKNNTRKRAVICVETGQRYDSAVEAMEATGIKNTTILSVCAHKPSFNSAGGYHWCFAEEYDPGNMVFKPAQKGRLPVERYALDTKETIQKYPSILAAANDGFQQHCIKNCCEGKKEQHKGYGWRYAEQ